MAKNRYIIMKASRLPGSGRAMPSDAYRGASCEDAGTPKGHIYDNEESAYQDVERLTDVNPVGFVVWQIDSNSPLQNESS